MSARTARAAAATLALLAAPAVAEDQNAGVAPKPFRAEPAGGASPTSAAVTLGDKEVRVDLTLSARAGAGVWLDLPRFGWLGEAESYPDRQFPELKIELDGRPVTPVERVSVLAGGADITAAVRAAGADPFAIAETPPFVDAVPGKEAALAKLIASGAVKRMPEGLFATWTAQRSVRVTPGAGHHLLSFRYTPRPAYRLAPLNSAGVRWADYCTTPAATARVLARHRLSGPVVVSDYSVPVALDGVRPRTIMLRSSFTGTGATIVCGAGGAALTDPAGENAVRTGADGGIHILRLAPPG